MPFLSLKSFSSLPLPSRSSLNSSTCPTKPPFKFHLPPPPSLALPSQGGQVLRNGTGMVCTFPSIPHCSVSVGPGYRVLCRVPSFPVGNTSQPSSSGSDIISSIRQFDVFRLQKPCLIWAPVVCFTKPFSCSWALILHVCLPL